MFIADSGSSFTRQSMETSDAIQRRWWNIWRRFHWRQKKRTGNFCE